jgi:hypothetical protein
MVGQLRHLLELSTLDNVTIQVLSFGAGAYGTMSGGLSILEFSEPDTPAVYLEYPAGGAWVENSDDVGRFTAMFSGVASAALSTVETTALIEVQLSKLEGR